MKRLEEAIELHRQVYRAAFEVDAAWSDAMEAMDDDNHIPPEIWDRWMATHRVLAARLDQVERSGRG